MCSTAQMGMSKPTIEGGMSAAVDGETITALAVNVTICREDNCALVPTTDVTTVKFTVGTFQVGEMEIVY